MESPMKYAIAFFIQISVVVLQSFTKLRELGAVFLQVVQFKRSIQ
jgi:hypothetical protein